MTSHSQDVALAACRAISQRQDDVKAFLEIVVEESAKRRLPPRVTELVRILMQVCVQERAQLDSAIEQAYGQRLG